VAAATAAVSVEMACLPRIDGRNQGTLARHLACHGPCCLYQSYDKLHLQLGLLRAELVHLAGASPT
jgi:hypothetical protein